HIMEILGFNNQAFSRLIQNDACPFPPIVPVDRAASGDGDQGLPVAVVTVSASTDSRGYPGDVEDPTNREWKLFLDDCERPPFIQIGTELKEFRHIRSLASG